MPRANKLTTGLCPIIVTQDSGHTEIGESRTERELTIGDRGVEQNVRGLDIAMQHVVIMSMLHGLCDPLHDRSRDAYVTALAKSSEKLSERFSFDQFIDLQRVIAVGDKIMQGHNMRMPQSRRCCRFAFNLPPI